SRNHWILVESQLVDRRVISPADLFADGQNFESTLVAGRIWLILRRHLYGSCVGFDGIEFDFSEDLSAWGVAPRVYCALVGLLVVEVGPFLRGRWHGLADCFDSHASLFSGGPDTEVL